MANRHMYNLKIPVQITKDDHVSEIRSKRGALLNLADRRSFFIGDHNIKIIADKITVSCLDGISK